MQNNRLILWAIFGLLAFMLYTKWQVANAPVPPPQTVESTQNSPNLNAGGNIPTINMPDMPNDTIDQAQIVSVKTDVFDIQISNSGNIVAVNLLKYPESLEKPDEAFRLLASDARHLFVTQAGLAGADNSGHAVFSDNVAPFIAAKTEYVMDAGTDILIVPLTYTDVNSGSTVTKVYEFKRGSYDVGLIQKVTNNSDSAWRGGSYVDLIQKNPKVSGQMIGASSYTGPVFSMGDEGYKKVAFDKARQLTRAEVEGTERMQPMVEGTRGWAAMIQQYFTSAWIKLDDTPSAIHIYKDARFADTVVVRLQDSVGITVNPGSSHEFKNYLYVGPKIKEDLVAAGEYTYLDKNSQEKTGNVKLYLTLDYGWLSFLSVIMFEILNFYHTYVGNWGWSIVLLTLTVKIALYWFSAKGYRSMAKMRQLGPQMELLKQQYGSDKQKIGQETLALYRKEKVNPMGGCWPMLIQIPIFISLFWMLQESVELRQAPWILWIHDLAVMDPYFILPIFMCGTMFVQQMFNPPPPDPMQAKIMKFMPLVFGFMFLWFASGIVLYWIVNNLLTILQQWIITRRLEATHKKVS